ncbi:M16 family metallopeptidase [Streptacidiphilus sp. EB129]|uniref:M16 family metallopeptidase n=1 Tax=Streptacidiphilus sp. EB129 TaxID=3156262 RepID=UPI003511A198
MNSPSTAGGRVLPPLPTTMPAAYVPAPGSIVEHTTSSGLRIVALRRPSVPVVELRLAVPFGGDGSAHAATADLLAAVLIGSTDRRDRASCEAELGLAGGSLRATVTPDRLTVRGAVAADGLGQALRVLGDVLDDSRRPEDEVLSQRTRLTHRLRMYRAQPRTAAREALLEQCFPGHPLTREVPLPEAVATVDSAQVAALHANALVPTGSRLVMVGDLDPAASVVAAEHALDGWSAVRAAVPMRDMPAPAPGLAVKGRRGGRQSQVQLLAPAPGAHDPRHPAARLASLILSGSMGSRLLARLRERDGLTYVVRASITDWPGGGLLALDFDTSPAHLAAALAAIREELDRFATDAPPDDDEIAATRNYRTGWMAITLASQSGTADVLHRLPPATRHADWLAAQPELIRQTSDSEVRSAAQGMASACFGGVVLTGPAGVGQAVQEVEAAGFRSAVPARAR